MVVNDAEVRGKLLRHFYNLRHANGGSVPATEEILAGSDYVRRDVLATICRQLGEANLIHWRPLLGSHEGHVVGIATITGHGVDAVEGRREPSIVIAGLSPQASQPSVLPDPQFSSVPVPAAASELLTLKPTFWGVSVDIKEASRRLRRWWKSRK